MMLTGKYSNKIDDKGRIIIPSDLRNSLGNRIWLVNMPDGCLNIFTQPGWFEYMAAYITNRDQKDELARQLQRFMLGGAEELEIDSKGRIKPRQDLIDFAGIKKDVIFFGVGGVVEIWGEEKLKKEMSPDNFDPKLAMAEAKVIGE